MISTTAWAFDERAASELRNVTALLFFVVRDDHGDGCIDGVIVK